MSEFLTIVLFIIPVVVILFGLAIIVSLTAMSRIKKFIAEKNK